ncbi:hypothetical protein FB451DRAFT_1187639 [Mycena latifolia]|nr:hypothetical protein FB451DRAFT_1187639 [Mycena latifolia]
MAPQLCFVAPRKDGANGIWHATIIGIVSRGSACATAKAETDSREEIDVSLAGIWIRVWGLLLEVRCENQCGFVEGDKQGEGCLEQYGVEGKAESQFMQEGSHPAVARQFVPSHTGAKKILMVQTRATVSESAEGTRLTLDRLEVLFHGVQSFFYKTNWGLVGGWLQNAASMWVHSWWEAGILAEVCSWHLPGARFRDCWPLPENPSWYTHAGTLAVYRRIHAEKGGYPEITGDRM